MAEFHAEAHFARHHVTAGGQHLQEAHGAAPILTARAHQLIHTLNHARGGDQRIAPRGRRRGAGVAILPDDHRIIPNLRLSAGHDANLLAFAFQDWALFDMQFEIGIRRKGRGLMRALISDGIKRFANTHAIHIAQAIGFFLRIDAGPNAATHQRMAEAAAFLIGPIHQFDRRFSHDVQVIQAPHHLKPRNHAKRAIKLAAGGLAIEMAAQQHRQALGITAFAAGKHIADGINAHGQAQRFAPAAKTIPPRLVHIGQRQALHAALRGGADFGHRHQTIPKPLAINALIRAAHVPLLSRVRFALPLARETAPVQGSSGPGGAGPAGVASSWPPCAS